MNDFAIGLIREYHAILLRQAKTLREYKEMIEKDDYMDIQWKCRVARNFVEVENHAREAIKKIKELREEYQCLDF